jgi:hypothetical protein
VCFSFQKTLNIQDAPVMAMGAGAPVAAQAKEVNIFLLGLCIASQVAIQSMIQT